MACPICVSPEGTVIADGIRAGAAVLIAVAGVLIALVARFGWRLWKLETAPQGAPCERNRA